MAQATVWFRPNCSHAQVGYDTRKRLSNHRMLRDLALPPGNRLEALSGNRKGQHSIRVNDQFRVRFVWTPRGPEDVEIVDYH
jgi:plasmid maintenance system killer protein